MYGMTQKDIYTYIYIYIYIYPDLERVKLPLIYIYIEMILNILPFTDLVLCFRLMRVMNFAVAVYRAHKY